jgi:hypothetical protein
MENIFGGSDEEDSVGKQDKPSDANSGEENIKYMLYNRYNNDL